MHGGSGMGVCVCVSECETPDFSVVNRSCMPVLAISSICVESCVSNPTEVGVFLKTDPKLYLFDILCV